MGSPQPYDVWIGNTQWGLGAPGLEPFGAILNIWVQDPLFRYRCVPPPTGYYLVGLLPTDEDDYLRAFKGYWMQVFEPDLYLTVP